MVIEQKIFENIKAHWFLYGGIFGTVLVLLILNPAPAVGTVAQEVTVTPSRSRVKFS